MIKIGRKVEGAKYTKRLASYAIIEREEDKKIAIATEGKTYFFLGGGIEGKETEIEALKREIIEEAGCSIRNIRYFDKVTSWADGGERGPLDVTATFYIANFDKKITEPIEKDHSVLWVNPKEYKDKLFHEFQRYILEEYINKKMYNLEEEMFLRRLRK